MENILNPENNLGDVSNNNLKSQFNNETPQNIKVEKKFESELQQKKEKLLNAIDKNNNRKVEFSKVEEEKSKNIFLFFFFTYINLVNQA
jgi:hypothetical protein